MGRGEEANRLARELEQAWGRAYFIHEFLADVLVAPGDRDRAMF